MVSPKQKLQSMEIIQRRVVEDVITSLLSLKRTYWVDIELFVVAGCFGWRLYRIDFFADVYLRETSCFWSKDRFKFSRRSSESVSFYILASKSFVPKGGDPHPGISAICHDIRRHLQIASMLTPCSVSRRETDLGFLGTAFRHHAVTRLRIHVTSSPGQKYNKHHPILILSIASFWTMIVFLVIVAVTTALNINVDVVESTIVSFRSSI